MTKTQYCKECFKEVVQPKRARTKEFCDVSCKSAYHNKLRQNGLRLLKDKYPEVYREIFQCTAA